VELLINSEASLRAAQKQLEIQFQEKKFVKAKLSYRRQRSLSQNAALHLFCQQLADKLNEAGLDQRKVMKPSADIPWNMESVKENLWRPIQKAVTGLDSTTKPKTSQYPAIYDVLNMHLATKFGISVEWPKRREDAS